MENNSKEFRKAQKVTIHCLDGKSEINITDDDILKQHYKFYTTEGKKSNQKTIAENEKKYLKAVENMLKTFSKDKVLNLIYSDYNNKKISEELLKKALAVLEQIKKVETTKVETKALSKEETRELEKLMEGKHKITIMDEVETAKVETRSLSKEEVRELEKLMEGKHKITRIDEDEELEK